MTLCVGCYLAAGAQATFTQRLQQSTTGEGKVTVTQDKAIDDLVNSLKEHPVQTTVPQKQADKTDKKVGNTTTATNQDKKPEKQITQDNTQATVLIPDTTENRKKVMRGQKITGYRVQVFAGGNSRDDRLKAERIGSEIKALFPGTPVYVHFYSPRWICRMGNYPTPEEAHEVLTRVKDLGYTSAIVVKGKITVSYSSPSSTNP